MEQRIVELPVTAWRGASTPALRGRACSALESGSVLFLPDLGFQLLASESRFLTPGLAVDAKNISFDPRARKLAHAEVDAGSAADLASMLARYSEHADALVRALLPAYEHGLARGRTSLRPVEIRGRRTSWRKDDTRLHVDSFPSTPVHGRRILRVFSNVNPHGATRTWRVGEPFEAVAQRFLHALAMPLPGSSRVLHALGITKGPRSAYDHLMLGLHDAMKKDAVYQTSADQQRFEFPAGSTWLVFTDQVSHAAMSGQHALEQTFYADVDAMRQPARSPLRVLERLKGRSLVPGRKTEERLLEA
jgi:hypothetical protein